MIYFILTETEVLKLMRKFILLIPMLAGLVFYSSSCNSTGYEIEEEENTDAPKTETRPEIKQDVETPKSDIKQEVNKDSKSNATSFVIQIGAFSVESNAIDFSQKAKKVLNYDISWYLIDGIYKVRLVSSYSRAEALSILNKIVEAGFKDSFVVQVNK
jgi:cell division protein FtsN